MFQNQSANAILGCFCTHGLRNRKFVAGRRWRPASAVGVVGLSDRVSQAYCTCSDACDRGVAHGGDRFHEQSAFAPRVICILFGGAGSAWPCQGIRNRHVLLKDPGPVKRTPGSFEPTPGSFTRIPGPFERIPVSVKKNAGSFQRTRGPLKGTRDPGPRDPLKGPWESFKGPRGPLKDPGVL